MRTLMMTALLAACLGLAACETVAGAGRDITNASEAVQKHM